MGQLSFKKVIFKRLWLLMDFFNLPSYWTLSNQAVTHPLSLRYCLPNPLYLDSTYLSLKINSGTKSNGSKWQTDHMNLYLKTGPQICRLSFHHPCIWGYLTGESPVQPMEGCELFGSCGTFDREFWGEGGCLYNFRTSKLERVFSWPVLLQGSL